jgi:hypothetical protein
MKNLIKSKIFIAAFLLTYFTFFIVTMWLFEYKAYTIGTNSSYGYPFPYYHESCFGGGWDYEGLVSNVFFAFGLSFFVGLFFSHFWLKFSSPEFRQKWHLNR